MNCSIWRGLASALVVCAGAVAHPPGADGDHHDHHQVDPPDPAKIRTWTSARTGEIVRGAFLTARTVDGVVQVSIERGSGDVVIFSLAELTEADQIEAQRRIDEVKAMNEQLAKQALSRPKLAAPATAKTDPPGQAAPFNAFAPFVTTRWDDRWLYVESDGLPHVPGGKPGTYVFSHPMMVGITAWQQQVPMPQNYRGSGVGGNAWRIPLKPQLADKPVSAKEQLFRGAIALAANGVPIFNPIKNDGRTDTFLAGELDEFGGHCGRADDYHYHIAPTHLQKYVGAGQPIAYALDGFPIYGLFDPLAKTDGPDADKCCPLGSHEPLDTLNGHFGAATRGNGPDGIGTVAVPGLYHYHASMKYPYLNGGMRGVVTVKDDQIDPQPRASSPRPALPPLRGATITGFNATGRDIVPAWSLEYTLERKQNFVNYRLADGTWIFDFVDPNGATKTETYDTTQPDRRPSGVGDARGRDASNEGRRRGDGGNRRSDRTPPAGTSRDGTGARGRPATSPTEPISKPVAGFTLSSVDVTDGRLSVECTCDAPHASRAPTLSWDKPPEGTKAFAIMMHHVTKDNDTHVYMVVANIPAAIRELKTGDATTGVWGQNSVNRKNAYTPPCSQGPGDKTYTLTIYALSAEAELPTVPTPLTRDSLLATIKDTTLATTTIDVKYARLGSDDGTDPKRNR